MCSHPENSIPPEEKGKNRGLRLSLRTILTGLFCLGLAGGMVYHTLRLERLNDRLDELIAKAEAPPLLSQLDQGEDVGVVFTDASMGRVWLPTLKGVDKMEYDVEAFFKVDGLMHYTSDTVETWRGIDVSVHQQEIDWPAVKAVGIDFAMIRLGYRGYTQGNIRMDEQFEVNIKGAIAAGLDVGVYFFSQAVSIEEAEEEARYAIDALDKYKLTYPVVYDWEMIGTTEARTDEISPILLTDCAITFCELVKGAGYRPMVYFNKRVGLMKYDLSRLDQYDFWLAEYLDQPTFYYHFDMWQYSSTGTIDGIEGNVDLNICFKKYGD